MGYCRLFAVYSFQIHAGCSFVILFENTLNILHFSMTRKKVAEKVSFGHMDQETYICEDKRHWITIILYLTAPVQALCF